MKYRFPLLAGFRNELVGHFKSMGWQIREALPEIEFSEELIVLDGHKGGLSGVFYDEDKKQYCDPSYLISDYIKDEIGERIIVYNNVLKSTAKRFNEIDRYFVVDGLRVDKTTLLHFVVEDKFIDYGISEEEAYEYLYYCVVLNETSKWILAESLDSNNNGFPDNALINKLMELPECLTALFSSWLLKESEVVTSINYAKAFHFLMNLKKSRGMYNDYISFTAVPILVVIKAIEKLRKGYPFKKSMLEVWIALYSELYEMLNEEYPFDEVEGFVKEKMRLQEVALEMYFKTDISDCDNLLVLISEENIHKYRGRILGRKFNL